MSIENRQKINHLLSNWPDGVVYTSRWLTAHGYSLQLIKRYELSGWIRRLGQGAYLKLSDKAKLSGAVYSLQEQLRLLIHIGGVSALELSGLAQYIPIHDPSKYFKTLYNTTKVNSKLPKWFKEAFPNCNYRHYYLFENEIGLEERKVDGINIMVSSPERAILEVLALIPDKFEFYHAFELCENLQLLRPELVQGLLQECVSVKVKRLFLYFADVHNLPCFSHLDINSINLGKGKRSIVSGGHFVSKYQIVVPEVPQE